MANDGDDVPEDETVTQTGHQDLRGNDRWSRPRFAFRSGLRTDRGENYMSVIVGRLTPEEAVPPVNPGDEAGTADAVRYALVRDLRTVGFDVRYQSSRTVPGHVAITIGRPWDAGVVERFDACFHEICSGPKRVSNE